MDFFDFVTVVTHAAHRFVLHRDRCGRSGEWRDERAPLVWSPEAERSEPCSGSWSLKR
jgi:hypothetical protein